VRALEGELARTIQLMRGVKAAGAHIVMADEVNMGAGRFWRLDREWPAHSAMNRALTAAGSRAAAQPEAVVVARKKQL
jgi:hypothetical protein